MIRPFTIICMVSAFGSGLYLYQSKHTAQVLDREITRTLKQTEVTRDRTNMLRAEWALLNEPDRLADLAKAHLSLQTLRPTQFVAMNDLASRLPAPVAAHPEPLPIEAEPEEVPVAQAAPTASPASAPAATKPREVAVAAEPKAKPEPKSVAVAETKPKQPERTVERPVERVAERQTERPVVARAEPRSAELASPVHARAYQRSPAMAGNEATAPGTVGAAVMRAMRARSGNEDVAMAPTPARAYAPPAYNPPAYTPPAYAQPAYAPPATSVLGGRSALPPPVPFAAR